MVELEERMHQGTETKTSCTPGQLLEVVPAVAFGHGRYDVEDAARSSALTQIISIFQAFDGKILTTESGDTRKVRCIVRKVILSEAELHFWDAVCSDKIDKKFNDVRKAF